MSEKITLNTQRRDVIGKKVAVLRRAGMTPAVLYGPETEPLSLQVDTKHLRSVLNQAGTTHLIHVAVEGDKKPRLAIARAWQLHPTRLTPLHADLLEVSERVPVQTHIPLRIGGKVPAIVQRNEAMMRVLLDRVAVRALPQDLPMEIVVNGGLLKQLSQVIRVSDITAPKGVRIMEDPDRAVARLGALRRGSIETGDVEEDEADGGEHAEAETDVDNGAADADNGDGGEA
ncbi:MAG: 50S ribosomal protein L25 [Anaerolineae bacterium]